VSDPRQSLEVEQISPDELTPRIDWSQVGNRKADKHSEIETAIARFFLLADDRVLVLESDDSKTHVARPELESPVVFVPVDEIGRGDFVLIREGENRDYLSAIANGILGDKAESHRAAQANWKRQLREKVASIGIEETIVQLKKNGCSKANYQNLRNWQSSSNIKTREKSDFDSLLRFTGQEELHESYWKQMETIHRAHSRAGQHVRESLIRQLEKADPNQLALSGKMIVELPETQTSGMSAVRVEDCSPDTIEIPKSMIGELISSEELPWQS